MLKIISDIYVHYCPVCPCAVLTFAPTALPKLMAFFSLCWPPEDSESVGRATPELGCSEAGPRRAGGCPSLEPWFTCCWATEFSNIL